MVAMAPPAASIAQDLPREPTVIYDGQVSMNLPANWREIDPDNLALLSEWAANATAGQSVEVYQYGYIPPEFETDPWLPHILVQIRESGRISYGEFLHLRPVEEIQSNSKNKFPQGLQPLVMGITVDRVSFDASTFCVRLEHALELRFKGPVRVQTAAFLTERGLVAIHHIDRKKRIKEGRTRFEAIVDSVSIAPGLRYQPRFIDRWPGLPYFAAAAVIAIALLAYILHRRAKS